MGSARILRLEDRVESVWSPSEALSVMVNRWPCDVQSEYHVARRACSTFLKRRSSTQTVRKAFVGAASQAGLLG
jgi:hypothetical protein